MSNPLSDAVGDYVEDHEEDLFLDWLETKDGEVAFFNWLMHPGQENLLERLMARFMGKESREKDLFLRYADEQAHNILTDKGEE